jgi:hypothetical protein
MISEIYDINPKNWLKKFQKTNILYLIRIGLFYHALGLGLMYLGSYFASSVISDYQIPQIPVSVSLALSSGILEESVFFGIPFYMTNSLFVLIGSGVVWSLAHLFNTEVISMQTLSYGGFLFSIPHVFFSLRTWLSGKGWFAILFHSSWNFIVLLSFCSFGLRQCSVIDSVFDFINVIMAISTVSILYLVYKSKRKNVNRYLYLIPVSIILISGFVLLLDTFNF